MTNCIVRWTHGDRTALVWTGGMALLASDIVPSTAAHVWARMRAGGTLADFLRCLCDGSSGGWLTPPDFAVVQWDDDRTHVAVRGDYVVHLATETEQPSVRGDGLTTWSERTYGPARAVGIVTADGSPDQGDALRAAGWPIVDGIVRAAHLVMALETAGEEPEPRMSATGLAVDPGLLTGGELASGRLDLPALPVNEAEADGGPAATTPMPPSSHAWPQVNSATPASPLGGPVAGDTDGETMRWDAPSGFDDPPRPKAERSAPGAATPAPGPGDRPDGHEQIDDEPRADGTVDDSVDRGQRGDEPPVDAASPRPHDPTPSPYAQDPWGTPHQPPADPIANDVVNPRGDAPSVEAPSEWKGGTTPNRPGRFSHLWANETMLRPVEDAAVRESPDAIAAETSPAGKDPASTTNTLGPVHAGGPDTPGEAPIGPRDNASGALGGASGELGEHDGMTMIRPIEALTARHTDQTILGRICVMRHANPPQRTSCRQCGGALSGAPEHISSPVLGWLRVPDAEDVELTGVIVVGRQPRASQVQGTSLPRLVALPHPHVSGSHLEIRVEGWGAAACDLESTNGTYLLRSGRPPLRLTTSPVSLADHDVLDLGRGVQLTVEGLP